MSTYYTDIVGSSAYTLYVRIQRTYGNGSVCTCNAIRTCTIACANKYCFCAYIVTEVNFTCRKINVVMSRVPATQETCVSLCVLVMMVSM